MTLRLSSAITLVLLLAGMAPAEWHHPLYRDGGGWWRGRVQVSVQNRSEQAAEGEPIAVTIGRGQGEAELVDQRAEAVRVVDAQGTEMLFAVVDPNGGRITSGTIPAGAQILLPIECPPGKSAVYFIYFDNPSAAEVADFLPGQIGVVNGDVEEGQGATPAGWEHDDSDAEHKASWSTENPQSGKRCLKTVVAPGAEPTWIATRQQGIAVQPGAKYRFTAWVRAENVRGTAGWFLHVGNRENPMLIAPMLNAGEGTFDWRLVRSEFTAPAGANRLELGTVLRGTGTAWFDNVRLERLEPGKLVATVQKPERMQLEDENSEPFWGWALHTEMPTDRRAVVRVPNMSDKDLDRSLVSVDVTSLRARIGVPDPFVVYPIDEKMNYIHFDRFGSLLLLPISLPSRSVKTFCIYPHRDAQKSAVTKMPEGVRMLGEWNLVQNPGFEQGEQGKAVWTRTNVDAKSGVQFSFESPGKKDLGKRAAKMHVPADAPQAWRGWNQSVKVNPGKTYLLAAWVKCQDAKDEIRVHVHFRTADGKLCKDGAMGSFGPGIRDTTDWTLMSGQFTASQDAAELQFHLTMQSSGTVWHDDVFAAEIIPATIARIEGRPTVSGGLTPTVWQVPSVVKVFEDEPSIKSPQPVRVSAARNEKESLQLAIRSGKAVPGMRVEVEPPVGPGGAKLEDFEINVVGYVPIDYPTNYYQSQSPAWHRKIPLQQPACDGWPGRWPDPLLPTNSFDLAPDRTQPVWITFSVPKQAAAGDYAGKVRWMAEEKLIAETPFTVHVWDFALPDASRLAAIYDVRLGQGASYWGKPGDQVQREIREFMAKRRLCADRIEPWPEIRYKDGRVEADFADFDKAAEHYFNVLKFPYSYTPPQFYLFGWGMPPPDKFGQRPYPGEPPYEGADRSKLRPEFKRAYQACLKAFWDHVKEKGWEKKFVLYISDEPFFTKPEIVAQMKALCDMIHEVDPAIPIYSSTWSHVPEWDGYLNVWGIGHYGRVAPEQMQKSRARGDRIWFTTDGQMCTDTPYCAVERLLPHYCFKYGAEAYEFWGVAWNTYDPFRFGWHAYIHQSDEPGRSYWIRYPNGDGFLLYPGPLVNHDGPVSSVRLEQAREGVEDYEYLCLLRQAIANTKAAGKDAAAAEKAMALAAELVDIPNAGGRYSSKILPYPGAVDRVRESLGQAIEATLRGQVKP